MAQQHKGSWFPVGPPKFDAAGKPYRDTSDGLKDYIPPIIAAQDQDPKLKAWAQSQGAAIGPDGQVTDTAAGGSGGGGFWHGNREWDSQGGKYDKPFNWGNLLALGVGGAIAAPLAAGAMGAGAGAGAAGGAATPAATTGISSATALGLPTAGVGGASAAGGAGLLGATSTVPAFGSLAPAAGATGPGLAAAGGGSGIGSQFLQQGGRVAANMAADRAGGRAAEANVNTISDRTRLGGAELNLKAPQSRASNAVRGDLLANLQPVTVNGPITGTHGKMPTISGGLSPALLSDNSRTLGKEMSRQALLDQMNGPAFTPTPMPQSGKLDTALNAAGYAGAGLTLAKNAGLLKKIPYLGGY